MFVNRCGRLGPDRAVHGPARAVEHALREPERAPRPALLPVAHPRQPGRAGRGPARRTVVSAEHPIYNNNESESALEACESLIAVLEQKAGQIRPILRAIHKRNTCLEARGEFERSLADQSRLTKRGGDLTKQLFREEKLQKKMKLLPKVNSRIRQLVQVWQKEHQQTFYYKGEPFLHQMERQDNKYRQKKKDREAARKAAKIEEMKHELKFGTRIPNRKTNGPIQYP